MSNQSNNNNHNNNNNFPLSDEILKQLSYFKNNGGNPPSGNLNLNSNNPNYPNSFNNNPPSLSQLLQQQNPNLAAMFMGQNKGGQGNNQSQGSMNSNNNPPNISQPKVNELLRKISTGNASFPPLNNPNGMNFPNSSQSVAPNNYRPNNGNSNLSHLGSNNGNNLGGNNSVSTNNAIYRNEGPNVNGGNYSNNSFAANQASNNAAALNALYNASNGNSSLLSQDQLKQYLNANNNLLTPQAQAQTQLNQLSNPAAFSNSLLNPLMPNLSSLGLPMALNPLNPLAGLTGGNPLLSGSGYNPNPYGLPSFPNSLPANDPQQQQINNSALLMQQLLLLQQITQLQQQLGVQGSLPLPSMFPSSVLPPQAPLPQPSLPQTGLPQQQSTTVSQSPSSKIPPTSNQGSGLEGLMPQFFSANQWNQQSSPDNAKPSPIDNNNNIKQDANSPIETRISHSTSNTTNSNNNAFNGNNPAVKSENLPRPNSSQINTGPSVAVVGPNQNLSQSTNSILQNIAAKHSASQPTTNQSSSGKETNSANSRSQPAFTIGGLPIDLTASTDDKRKTRGSQDEGTRNSFASPSDEALSGNTTVSSYQTGKGGDLPTDLKLADIAHVIEAATRSIKENAHLIAANMVCRVNGIPASQFIPAKPSSTSSKNSNVMVQALASIEAKTVPAVEYIHIEGKESSKDKREERKKGPVTDDDIRMMKDRRTGNKSKASSGVPKKRGRPPKNRFENQPSEPLAITKAPASSVSSVGDHKTQNPQLVHIDDDEEEEDPDNSDIETDSQMSMGGDDDIGDEDDDDESLKSSESSIVQLRAPVSESAVKEEKRASNSNSGQKRRHSEELQRPTHEQSKEYFLEESPKNLKGKEVKKEKGQVTKIVDSEDNSEVEEFRDGVDGSRRPSTRSASKTTPVPTPAKSNKKRRY